MTRGWVVGQIGWGGPPATVAYSWRADDLALSDGALVSSWADSINGLTVTAGSGVEPTFKTGILNSLPVVRSTVAGKQLFNAGPIPSDLQGTDYTYFAVVYPTSAGVSGAIPGRTAFTFGPDFSHPGSGLAIDDTSQAVSFSPIEAVAGGSILNGWHLLTLRRNTTAGTLIVRVDGTTVATTTLGAPTAPGSSMAIFDDTHSYPNTTWVGDIAQIDVYVEALADADVTTVEAALTAKWGL